MLPLLIKKCVYSKTAYKLWIPSQNSCENDLKTCFTINNWYTLLITPMNKFSSKGIKNFKQLSIFE